MTSGRGGGGRAGGVRWEGMNACLYVYLRVDGVLKSACQ